MPSTAISPDPSASTLETSATASAASMTAAMASMPGMSSMSRGSATSTNMADMSMPTDASIAPLDPSQFDFSNETQASDFLGQLLDDSVLQYDAQDFAAYFWYAVLAFIVLIAALNLLWKCSLWSKKRAAAARRSTSAKLAVAPIGALKGLCRRLTYLQFTPSRTRLWLRIPPLGTILLLIGYLGLVLALESANNDVEGAQYYTSLSIRAGWLAIAQMPLLILLAGKNNLIGLVVGTSYERLNILHRWVARALLLLAILHMGVFNASWNKYGVRSLEWSTDSCVPTGFAAFALLLWMNLSTLAPFRHFSYKFFVAQHVLTFIGFIVAIMYHLPSTALETRTYIWIPIGLYLFDRLVRTIRVTCNNSRSSRAVITSIDDEVSKIRIHGSRVRKWTPGSFVLLSIPRFDLAQSHPATILSTPSSHDGDLVFLLKAHNGFTRKLLSASNASFSSLTSANGIKESQQMQESHRAFLDGPYGGSQSDLAAFDTVLLIAGSIGVSFVLAGLLHLADRAGKTKLPLRRLELIWAVKRSSHIEWVSQELDAAYNLLQAAGVEVTFRTFVTCDIAITDSSVRCPSHRCGCDVAHGNPCCCADPMSAAERSPEGQSQVRGSLQCATVASGRPDVRAVLQELAAQAEGEVGVAVCGPLGLNKAVRKAVVDATSAKQHTYLHVEGFGW